MSTFTYFSSLMRLITCGVAHVYVLCAVLFLVYSNDIICICNRSNLIKFVLFDGGTNIFCSSTSLHDLHDTTNTELAKRCVYMQALMLCYIE